MIRLPSYRAIIQVARHAGEGSHIGACYKAHTTHRHRHNSQMVTVHAVAQSGFGKGTNELYDK